MQQAEFEKKEAELERLERVCHARSIQRRDGIGLELSKYYIAL